MRLDELPTSDRIEDRRGFPGGRAGLGIGTVVILSLIGWALGIDPSALIGGAEILSGSGQQQTEAGSTGAPSDQMGHFVSAILGSTEVEWKDVFAQAGKTYQPPTLVMFSGATQSACGFAQAAMGPFYCPLDQKVYLDTSFFQDLERRFRACDVGSKTFAGTEVQLVRTAEAIHDVICVRRRDDQDCSWVFRSGIVPAAIYDREQADTKGFIDRSNEYFDRVHPECKEWRENKDLPDYCY
jgi:hypothetical protein